MDHFCTERLTAERPREDHLADLVTLHLDVEVSRYLGGVRSAETTEKYLAVNMTHWDQHGFGLWALRTKDGAFAGRAGLRHILVDDVDEIEIFYAFTRSLWGRGFASEIATAMTRIGLSQLALPSLIGLV
jgi:RimJ/RimL family protein N-acetyltransferase